MQKNLPTKHHEIHENGSRGEKLLVLDKIAGQ